MSTAIARLLARTAAVALLLALIAGAAQIVVMPIAAHIETLRERIDQERLMLGRLASMQASTEQLSERDAAARAARTASLFLEGESDAIRLANLQSLLADIAAKTGAKLRSTRTVSPRERNDLHLLGLQLQLSASIEQLQALLVAIEAQVPDLFVEALHVAPAANAQGPRAEGAGTLEIRLEVAGVAPRAKG